MKTSITTEQLTELYKIAIASERECHSGKFKDIAAIIQRGVSHGCDANHLIDGEYACGVFKDDYMTYISIQELTELYTYIFQEDFDRYTDDWLNDQIINAMRFDCILKDLIKCTNSWKDSRYLKNMFYVLGRLGG